MEIIIIKIKYFVQIVEIVNVYYIQIIIIFPYLINIILKEKVKDKE
jgi:hypothetical protein